MRLQKLIPNSLYFLLSFGLIVNGQSSIASLKNQYQKVDGIYESCTQYTDSRNKLYWCIVDNNVYRRMVNEIGRVTESSLDHVGIIGNSKQINDTLLQWEIEGNNLVVYSCKGYGSCSGSVSKSNVATKR